MRGAPRITSRGTLCASLCVLAIVLVCATAGAEAGAAGAPAHLVDGSRPPRLPAALRGQSRALVVTRVTLMAASRLRAQVAACVPGERIPGRRKVVERVGASGRTLTFIGLTGSAVACDRSLRSVPKPWCGRAAWPFRDGRVSDGRLSICTDRRGRAVAAFAWINRMRRARWIVVDQPGFGEVYPVVGPLPVRVSTFAGIAYGRATFRFREYDERGVVLASRTISLAVAG